MGRRTTKTLSMSVDIAERLEQEENQSATVEKALKEYWGADWAYPGGEDDESV